MKSPSKTLAIDDSRTHKKSNDKHIYHDDYFVIDTDPADLQHEHTLHESVALCHMSSFFGRAVIHF